MRRPILLLLVILMLTAFGGASGIAAQDTSSTPSSNALTSLGLPELNVTVNDTTIDGLPDELAANRYLVHVTAEGSALAGVEFARPADMSIDEFVDALAMVHGSHGHDESTDGEANEHATVDAGHDDEHGSHGDSTAEDDHGMDMMDPTAEDMPGMASELSPVFDATFAGGIVVESGQTADVVVDLSPGEWVATGGPDAAQEPVAFTVTGEMPGDLPDPESNATLTMGEYVIEVTEGELTSGPQVIKVENIGAQPHFIDFSVSSVEVTRDDVLAAVGADGAGTPQAASGFDVNEDLQRVMTTTTQSRGMTMWVTVDLSPGTYVVQCHFPDIQDNRTHAAHGMVNVFTIPE